MADTLTKAKLADLLHNRVGVTKKEAGDLVDEVFGLMRDTLIDGEKVKISGFGNFVVETRPRDAGRNPRDERRDHHCSTSRAQFFAPRFFALRSTRTKHD